MLQHDYEGAVRESRRRYLYRDNDDSSGHDASSYLDDPRESFRFVEEALKNPGDNELIVEGDIGRRPKVRQGGRRQKRGYAHDDLWPFNEVIPVWINGSSFADSANAMTKVRAALKGFTDNSCLRFSVSLTRPTNYHIIVQGHRSGCWANVGYQDAQEYQIVNLSERSLCLGFGLIQHEMAHAIGIEHEQTRVDSSRYIYYHPENARDHQPFSVYSASDTSIVTPYDVSSVMHYSSLAFTANSYKTMTAKQPELDGLMGSYVGASFFDYLTINHMYECSAGCPRRTCHYGGYLTKLGGTCQCVCPEGLGGSDCRQIDRAKYPCGGIISINERSPHTLSTPNSVRTGNIPLGVKCVWLFEEAEGKPLKASFGEEFELRTDVELEIRANHIQQLASQVYYGDVAPPPISTRRYRESNLMLVLLDTSSAQQAVKGFSLTVETDYDGCVGNPCLGAFCKSFPGESTFKCRRTAEVHCLFEHGLAGPCSDIQLNNITFDGSTTPFPLSLIEGGVRALPDWSRQVKVGAMKTAGKKIRNVGCVGYRYDLTDADTGVLKVHQYRDGENVTTLRTHTAAAGSGFVQVPFTASNRDLTEIVFEFYNSKPFAYNTPIYVHEVHLISDSCPTGECTNFPCGTLECSPTGSGRPRCLMRDDHVNCTFAEDCFRASPQVDISLQPGATARWFPNRGTTPTAYTGPNNGYEGDDYIYAEASSNYGGTATMLTQPLKGGTDFCITFMYHMYGSDIGRLKVFMMVDGVRKPSPLWSKQGVNTYRNGDNRWKEAKISVANNLVGPTTDLQNVQIAFDAVFRSGPYGDIAMDELSVVPHLCN
ncbi:uncharacterized protein [Watersipora subatra]|uniref:uncharacterized protein n=1 Tax=Watersipora subatra TaxID=2589382 RepID=UPI00355B810B